MPGCASAAVLLPRLWVTDFQTGSVLRLSIHWRSDDGDTDTYRSARAGLAISNFLTSSASFVLSPCFTCLTYQLSILT